jgi:hypothetical protein
MPKQMILILIASMRRQEAGILYTMWNRLSLSHHKKRQSTRSDISENFMSSFLNFCETTPKVHDESIFLQCKAFGEEYHE